jgi:hypothetical protein
MADRGVKIQLRNPFDMYLKLLNSLFTAIFMYLVIIRVIIILNRLITIIVKMFEDLSFLWDLLVSSQQFKEL